MKKIRLFHGFVLEIWLIKKSCNLVDWEHFGPYLTKKKFSQTWDLYRNTANNISFHYRTNSVKINDQIFQQIQKTLFLAYFLVHFPNFGGKTFFPENLALYGFLPQCQNLEKTNDAILRKCLDRWKDRGMEGWKDKQTLFYRTLLATTGGPLIKLI